MTRLLHILVMLTAIAWPCAATAGWFDDEPIERNHLGLGVAAGVPGDGSGIPTAADGSTHLPMNVVGRWRFTRLVALGFGFGLPIAGEGITAWAAAELSLEPWRSADDAVAFRLYAAPGVQFGFVGDGYFATHSHVFVGWEYIYSGPMTPSVRLGVGAALAFFRHRFELFAEALGVLSFLPSPFAAPGGAFGVRVYF